MSNSLLLVHAFNFGLKNSPCSTLHLIECTCNISHILFTYIPISNKLLILLNSLVSFNIPFNLPFIVNTNYKTDINIIKKSILKTDFIINILILFHFIYFFLFPPFKIIIELSWLI